MQNRVRSVLFLLLYKQALSFGKAGSKTMPSSQKPKDHVSRVSWRTVCGQTNRLYFGEKDDRNVPGRLRWDIVVQLLDIVDVSA
ncbi:hypothetical protein CHS0354_032649 [Potamilus streckersoni]|uniref:Secreted protein n=1 Tax=Potamilus streckersoni TaxID=2493646 RepID=A0AAE0SF72_9BIVA|nr:hypothetical protein CHS0354_032649 [Potamilus streckersoni]